ncbi:class I lanthipeptide [uncultured Kordia sp.]|uniref:class I lanthipeptide n=1 Tax=uncultured Kordia sp. TaxID=507699 RepID=UPI002607B46D|nr:class I lanthipeptide [uncultured Kordia sp.]
MKKQNKGLKLNKSVVSELSLENAGEVKGGKTGAGTFCNTNQPGCLTGWGCPLTQWNCPRTIDC